MNLVSAKMPNQLVMNGNFEDGSHWGIGSTQATFENNILTIPNWSYESTHWVVQPEIILVDSTHKYYLTAMLKPSMSGNFTEAIRLPYSSSSVPYLTANEWNTYQQIITFNAETYSRVTFRGAFAVGTATLQVRNTMLIDLTELYGSGNEPSTVAQFKADFPLDYYPYRATSQDVLLTANNAPVTVEPSAVLPSDMGVIDLGERTWIRDTYQSYHYFRTMYEITDADASQASYTTPAILLCTKYSPQFYHAVMYSGQNKTIGFYSDGRVVVCDDDYTDAQSFKQAMQGQLLFYKKA